MNFDRNEYLTVKEAAGLTGKSESTIKRFVNVNKGKKKHFKFETLPTGHKKIYVSKTFLTVSFDHKPTSNTKSDPLKADSKDSGNQPFVDYLLSQLAQKEEQLKAKDQRIEALMDKQMDNVDKLLVLQDQAQQLQSQQLQSQQKQIEDDSSKKKRWWQRK